ncbi:MAG TPA: hypothetical protein VGF42_02545 [Caulobacteraceae bacterium]|jgi:hypothetical protein
MTNWITSPPWARRAAPAPATGQTPQVPRAELLSAYRNGRLDEAKRRHGSPLLAFIGLVACAAVALMVYLAAQNGSFSNGGAVVDHNLANASQRVQAPIKNAESKAGNALENAGQSLKQRAGDQTPRQ